MKPSRRLIWHTASLKSGTQIRMKIQPMAVKIVIGSAAPTNGSRATQLAVIANRVRLLF